MLSDVNIKHPIQDRKASDIAKEGIESPNEDIEKVKESIEKAKEVTEKPNENVESAKGSNEIDLSARLENKTFDQEKGCPDKNPNLKGQTKQWESIEPAAIEAEIVPIPEVTRSSETAQELSLKMNPTAISEKESIESTTSGIKRKEVIESLKLFNEKIKMLIEQINDVSEKLGKAKESILGKAYEEANECVEKAKESIDKAYEVSNKGVRKAKDLIESSKSIEIDSLPLLEKKVVEVEISESEFSESDTKFGKESD